MEVLSQPNIHEWVFNHLPLGNVQKEALLQALREERKQGLCLGTDSCPGDKHGCCKAQTKEDYFKYGGKCISYGLQTGDVSNVPPQHECDFIVGKTATTESLQTNE